MDDKNVPGRNIAPSRVRVFMDMLSLRLALAMRCCWKASSILNLDSSLAVNVVTCVLLFSLCRLKHAAACDLRCPVVDSNVAVLYEYSSQDPRVCSS